MSKYYNYVAIDVYYNETDPDNIIATAGIVCWDKVEDAKPQATFTYSMTITAPYVPGQFFLREMPVIVEALHQHTIIPKFLFIDGLCELPPESLGKGWRPALGSHTLLELHKDKDYANTKIIGVAKNPFKNFPKEQEVVRNPHIAKCSKKSLYITCLGMSIHNAKMAVMFMAGSSREPFLLKMADKLSKGKEI